MLITVILALHCSTVHARDLSVEEASQNRARAYNEYYKAIKARKPQTEAEKKQLEEQHLKGVDRDLSRAVDQKLDRLEKEYEAPSVEAFVSEKEKAPEKEKKGITRSSSQTYSSPSTSRLPAQRSKKDAVIIDGSQFPKEIEFPAK